MTGWHDQPPQTRRQVRMSERGGATHAQYPSAPGGDGTAPFTTTSRSTVDEQTDPSETARKAAAEALAGHFTGAPTPSRGEPRAAEAPLGRRAAREAAARDSVIRDAAIRDAAIRDAAIRDAAVRNVDSARLREVPTAPAAPAARTQESPAAKTAVTTPSAEERPLTRRELRERAQQAQRAEAPIETAAPTAYAAPTEPPVFVEPPVSVEPRAFAEPTAFVEPPALHEPPALVEPPQAEVPVFEVPTYTPPTGHWTTQEALDDATQAPASVTSRDLSVSTGPVTSSVFVMPMGLQSGGFTGPVGTTGEVLITGSISLPASLGTTGAHPGRYDRSDLDAIIEAVDRDDFEGDSAPVRAIRAVSTHTAPRDIIAATSKKSSGSRLPVVLAIIAGAMMVSVTVLVIAAFASNAL